MVDFIFAATITFWFLSLLIGSTKIRTGRFYLPLAGFAGAVILTSLMTPTHGFSRVLIQAYLISLAVLTYNLVKSRHDIEKVWFAWSSTALITAISILVSVLLFYIADIKDSNVNPVLWDGGSLPVGNYPRVRGFFLNGNMTGNYLAISACFCFGLALLRKPKLYRLLLICGALMAFSALFTISTALGGLGLVIGLMMWALANRDPNLRFLKIALPLAIIGAAFLLIYAATYPRYIDSEITFEASPRWLAWKSSIVSVVKHPWFGNGLGAELADVHYHSYRGARQHLTDPHNVWLSVSGQMGVVGLIAFLALLVWLCRTTLVAFREGSRSIGARVGLGGALLVVVYQSFSCSLEDMRHVWILFGLVAATADIQLTEQVQNNSLRLSQTIINITPHPRLNPSPGSMVYFSKKVRNILDTTPPTAPHLAWQTRQRRSGLSP